MSSLLTSVLLVILSQVVPGCSLFRLNTVKGASDGGGGVITRLEIVVPEIAVKFGWGDVGWISQNASFVAGIVMSAILVVGIYAVTRLTRR